MRIDGVYFSPEQAKLIKKKIYELKEKLDKIRPLEHYVQIVTLLRGVFGLELTLSDNNKN